MREVAQRIQLLDEQLARTKVRLHRITTAARPISWPVRAWVRIPRRPTWSAPATTAPAAQRKGLRFLGRREPDTREQRQDETASTEPRRRPPTQLGAMADRNGPPRHRRRLPRLSRAPCQRRQDQDRSRPVHQALPRARTFAALPQTAAG
jgi:hypothetical protein